MNLHGWQEVVKDVAEKTTDLTLGSAISGYFRKFGEEKYFNKQKENSKDIPYAKIINKAIFPICLSALVYSALVLVTEPNPSKRQVRSGVGISFVMALLAVTPEYKKSESKN